MWGGWGSLEGALWEGPEVEAQEVSRMTSRDGGAGQGSPSEGRGGIG